MGQGRIMGVPDMTALTGANFSKNSAGLIEIQWLLLGVKRKSILEGGQ